MTDQGRTLAAMLSSSEPTGKAAEEALHAIVLGDADAIVVQTKGGPRVYTLRDASEPYRELVERMPGAAVVLDADHTILYCNGGLPRMLGSDELAGMDFLDVVATDHKSRARGLLSAAASGRFDTEMALVTSDGVSTRVRASAAPMSFDGQSCIALVVTALDEIEALRESEERYRLLVEQAVDGIFLSDAEGRYVAVNSAGHKMLGYTREEILTRKIGDLLAPEETDQLALAIARLSAGEVTRSDWRFRRKDGSEFVGEVVGRQLPGGQMLGILRDITERKKMEEHIRFLMSEVNHRSKNLLNLVQSIAKLSAKDADPFTFASDLSKRIAALAACQDLHLSSEKGLEIGDLVSAQLSPFRELFDSRVVISGPAARLKSSAAQAIGMSLHELATNAAKYGALSNSLGRVRIGWEIAEQGEKPTFSISWLEENGPKVAPPTRKGFGQKVIVSMAQKAVDGKVDLEFRETGVFWKLQSAIADTLDY